MRQLFDHHAFDVLSAENGLLIVEKLDDAENRVIRYKYIASNNLRNIRPITKATFLSAKFMNNYEYFAEHIENYILTRIAWVGTSLMIVSPFDGFAKLVDKHGSLVWKGHLKYKDEVPTDIAIHNNAIWAVFPRNNSLVRFSMKTMREELILGGPNDTAFNRPISLHICDDDHLMICNRGNNKLIELDLNSFSVNDYLTCADPLKKYIRIDNNEFVLLDSGLYEI